MVSSTRSILTRRSQLFVKHAWLWPRFRLVLFPSWQVFRLSRISPAFEDISGFRGYHLAFTKMMTKSNERTRREECLKKEYKNTKKSQSMEMMVMMRQNCRGSLIEPVICSAWPQVTNYKDALTLIYEKCLNNRLRVSHPCPSSSSCCLNDDPVEVHIICSSAGLPYVSPISHLGVSVFSFCMCEGY